MQIKFDTNVQTAFAASSMASSASYQVEQLKVSDVVMNISDLPSQSKQSRTQLIP